MITIHVNHKEISQKSVSQFFSYATSFCLVGIMCGALVYIVMLFKTTQAITLAEETSQKIQTLNSDIAVLELEYLASTQNLDEGVFEQYGFYHPQEDLLFVARSDQGVNVAQAR